MDKCLPFGASISYALFQKFSDALCFIAERETDSIGLITNYLDDFLFLALTLGLCNDKLKRFLEVCDDIGVPIALEKTEWASALVVFLGILLDGKNMRLAVPSEKHNKTINLLQLIRNKKKATVKGLQTLCGYLNFLCKAIFPGRPFIRCMYAKYSKTIPALNCKTSELDKDHGKFLLKPFHHVQIDSEFKFDCDVWLEFLMNGKDTGNIINRPMIDLLGHVRTLEEIRFYSVASGAKNLGFGCILGNH